MDIAGFERHHLEDNLFRAMCASTQLLPCVLLALDLNRVIAVAFVDIFTVVRASMGVEHTVVNIDMSLVQMASPVGTTLSVARSGFRDAEVQLRELWSYDYDKFD